MRTHLCIIYDSITNSVFESQLLIPFAHYLTTQTNGHGLLISFERTMPPERYRAILARYPNITLIILKKIPFVGSISLYYAAYQLAKIITPYSIISIRARGALAGWIAGHARALSHVPTVVQARGLAGQEYSYEHGTRSIFHALRAYLYTAAERWCYSVYARKSTVTIHAVSAAMRSYLITAFNVPADKITIEQHDIPALIDAQNKLMWRQEIRTKYSIADSTHVYVYSGSAKSWQCPDATVAYFAQQYEKNNDSFLLLLTQDTHIFQKLCAQYTLADHSFTILTVSYLDMYRYLAAADSGIIIRDKHIINWVSRPTKVLEYWSVGLQIVHNGTIEMLVQHDLDTQQLP